MKKTIYLFLFCLVSLEIAAQNILQDSSFEISDGQGGVEFWGKRPTSWQDSEVFLSGNHSYRMGPDVNQYSFYTIEPDSILVGREYTLSAWTKTENNNPIAVAYWRYINFSGGGNQFAPFDMNNLEDTNWTYFEWDFYPENGDARLDIFWNFSEGNFWIDDVSMSLKERTVEKIHSLPEPWRLNIGDQDTCTVFVELQDAGGFRVSNAFDEVIFNNLDPDILTLITPQMVNAEFGKTSAKFIGTNTAGIGRIEIQSGNLRDTLWISNREKYVHDSFFHIGTMLFPGWNPSTNAQLIEDLDSFGLNIVFPINGGTAGTVNFLEAIQNSGKDIKVIAQTHLINSASESFYPEKNWAGAVAKAQEYADLFTPYDSPLFGYRLYDEPNYEFDHHNTAFHSNALYAADSKRQAITIDAWDFHLTERNMRIRNNDFKLTYLYPFNTFVPLGIYPFDYGVADSEMGFDSISRYDHKPWFHMIQSFTMDLPPPTKRWPEAGEMKQQAYSAVSFGAKGIYYFFYHDLPGHPQEIRGLTEAGYPIVHRQLWQPAREINWNLRNNERIFLKGTHNPHSIFANSDNNLVRMADFELDEPNGKYVMLVNKNALEATEVWVDVLVPDIDSVENKFTTGGEILDVVDDMVLVKIEAGDAMLLNLKEKTVNLFEVQDIDNELFVFPNPTPEQINIHFKKSVKNADLILTDSFGRLIFSKKVTGRQTAFSVEDLAKGVYFLSVQTAEKIFTEKVLVE